MAQKRYKLIIWFYLKNHHKYKTIHVLMTWKWNSLERLI